MNCKALSRSIASAWLIAATATLCAAWTYAQAVDEPVQLAPEVHADVLRNQIDAAVKANNLAGTLSYIDEYKALGVPFPTALLFVEAQAAETVGDTARALNALTVFMNKADRKSEQYKQAVTLYPSYAAAAAAGSQKHSNAKQDDDAEKLAAANAKMQADAEAKAAQARATEDRPTEIAKFVAEIKSELVSISGGKLEVGSYLPTLKASKPVHDAQVKSFRVASAALTCQQFKKYAALSGANAAEAWCDQIPKISWSQGQQLLAWLNQQSPFKFRMISEVEWEWIATNRSGPARVSVYGRELAQRTGLGFDVQLATTIAQPEWVADCQHANYKGAPSNSVAWTDGGDCTRRVMRGASIVRRVEHRQFGMSKENLNFYTFDDAAFVKERAFGLADQPCGGMAQCSMRVAADE